MNCLSYFIWMFIFFIITLFLSLNFLLTGGVFLIEYKLMLINSIQFNYVILLDWMSLMFISFVLLISSSVIIYSMEYMAGDLNFYRFIYLVMMFVMSMLLMIMSPSLISILLGWDGLGLVSYCLVIYYQNESSSNAGMITFLTNRVGDVALLMSICWMINYGSLNFTQYLMVVKNDYYMIYISFMVMLACITKSAQIPFSSWLPAAMAAPTPVSSLVHSSTLVTAGVYLTIRFFNGFSSFLMYLMLMVSVITMFMSGLGANFEFDLKKIIALSTLSQLGLMFSVIFMGEFKLGFFHLIIHALFKALLFMCAGLIIHNCLDNQDIRFLGGTINSFPLTSSYFMICNFSLCGLPFMSGFYSKDLIIEFYSMEEFNFFIYLMIMISVGFTVSYSVRLFYYLYNKDKTFFSLTYQKEQWGMMLFGMSLLMVSVLLSGSIFSWFIMKPFLVFIPMFMKLMVLIFIFLGFLMGLIGSQFYFYYSSFSLNNLMMASFLGSMWNMKLISTYWVIKIPIFFSKLTYSNYDQGWFEYYGFNSMKKLILFTNLILQKFSLVYMKIFLLMIIVIFINLFIL
uniref:NADH-ubiquinone oxidoreductase chain 5 n=1 Tax=Downesia tarsata TaxID=2790390 RepID=A0A7T1C5H7_9CUCU|nr:NADH dehydrogenase subunit 5 [Downesia tarsata]QPM99432.1 NADH dehydrogenase subunit 5 [Downesia tarsata]